MSVLAKQLFCEDTFLLIAGTPKAAPLVQAPRKEEFSIYNSTLDSNFSSLQFSNN